MSNSPKRICLWSGPRNVSTALMYSFAQRNDTRVVDEPLYAHYLRVSGAEHPGREQVLSAQNSDGDSVVQAVVLAPSETKVVFFKQMAHHLIALDKSFLNQVTSVFLIRDPREMLPSLVQQIPHPVLGDTGLKIQRELYDELAADGQDPPVLDAKELLLDPQSVLQELCERVALLFQPGMLEWTPGPRPEDGVWAEHWYHNVHRSSRFQRYRPKTEAFPEPLVPLLQECRPHYDQLYKNAIRGH